MFATCFGGPLLPLFIAIFAWTQSSLSLRDTSEQFLQDHHISITKQAVITALRNDDAEIRREASRVLSSHWPKEAAAPIQIAMLQEGDELVRVSLATDLARLGDKAGREMLLTECHNTGDWGTTRMYAARGLTELHDDSCVDSVLEILRSDSDPQDTVAKSDALELLPSFIHDFTGEEYRRVLNLAVSALNDPAVGVRLTAAITLGRVGDTSAIPALQAALTTEQDATIHSAILVELKRLKNLQKERK